MTKTPTTIDQRRLESAIHESAHFVASVLHGAYIRDVRILPVSGRAIGTPYRPGLRCLGYVVSYLGVAESYNDGFIDLCGCVIAELRGDCWQQWDYNNAKDALCAEQFRQCQEDACMFVYTNRDLIEQVGRELLAIAKPDGKFTRKSLKQLESYTKGLLNRHYAASKVRAAAILAAKKPQLDELRRRYAEAE
ncbi:MAG: hypothetical protein ABTS16_05770 [Candidatus Accumulibacter phosphatis]|jgi:hypothetical protein|uniref:Uncharacterized protein n=1 Tax=Candidatus Accumulibacter contiguus TaxID=2954381 RepID=A0ABX1TG83_9PROT|nr:hypothetical protein [Candidatus Accumulibacter contiguus]NMQ07560.1 hypothetical protein [Candidatus Accumulibacter contiguus]